MLAQTPSIVSANLQKASVIKNNIINFFGKSEKIQVFYQAL
jgi:hypothetical protein